MLSKRLNILILSIIILCNACEDKDPTKPGYQRKPPAPEFYKFEIGEAKNYLWAKEGSYWIYKQTVTGDLDTHTVTGFAFYTKQSKGTQDYSKHITIEYDMLIRNIYSSFNKKSYYDKTVSWTPNDQDFKNWRVIIDRQTYGGIGTPFFFPFAFNSFSGDTKCVGEDTILIVQGKKYLNVVKFEISIDDMWENSPPYTGSVYYWAKVVGLIKRSAKHKTDNWELIDSHISP